MIQQKDDQTFNKAMLLNTGYIEAMKISDWDCLGGFIITNISYLISHTSYIIPHTLYLIPHYLIPHTSLPHTSYLVPHTSYLTFSVFHDVDLLPEDDRNLYTCSDQANYTN